MKHPTIAEASTYDLFAEIVRRYKAEIGIEASLDHFDRINLYAMLDRHLNRIDPGSNPFK